MRARFLSLALVASAFGVASSAFAGYTAVSNTFTVANGDTDASGNGTVGDTITVDNGGFVSFTGDNPPTDPSVVGGDLDRFKFDLDGTVSSVLGNVANYTGTYTIYYDANLNGLQDEGITVSAGTFTLSAAFAAGNTAALTGQLTQTAGPSGPGSTNFRDLGTTYNGNPVDLTGTFVGNPTNPLTAAAQVTLRQNAAPVPEPATMAALGLGALAMVRRRASRS